jgi:TonB family protein
MNPVVDLRTRRLLLCISIACLAVMVFAAGATKSEAGTLQVSPNRDIRERIVTALQGPRTHKSFRMRQVWSGADRRATLVMEVMKPDRSHTIQNDNDETIFIGEKGYSRKGNGPWTKFTDGMTQDFSRFQSDISEQIKRIGQVKFIGADTLDGVSVLAYEYEYIDASGKKIAGPYKIWIGLNDGLAYKTESETQCPAESWGGKPGDTSLVTIKVVTTYDFNAKIIIDLPGKAAREAAESWLKFVDAGRYSDSWAEAASVLKERYSEKSWELRLNGFAEQASALGPIKSRELIGVEFVKSLPSDHEREGVLLSYRGQLVYRGPNEKWGARSQTLELVLDADQVWRVANYTEVVPPRMDGSTPGVGFNVGGGRGGGMGPSVSPGPSPTLSVDTRPVQLNQPVPQYTEEARKNKIQGVVVVRVLIGTDGLVKRVSVVRGLPDGLDEQAIQAAYKLRFTPAMKDGKAVAYQRNIPIEFNLR